jgi:hypothetical protein
MFKHTRMSAGALARHVGTMKQLAGIRAAVLDDGKARGVRVAEVRNGSGLCFTVLLDRGMDIGEASYRGLPLAFLTPAGFAHPHSFEPEGYGWLRNWGGGLVTGCGLTNVGLPAAPDAGRVDGPLGLHGRLSNTPAENCECHEGWERGRYRLMVAGSVRQCSLFGENLELRRTVSTAMGDDRIVIRDVVTNRGFRPSALMLLYHINLGFPLVDETARLVAERHAVRARTPAAAAGLRTWSRCQPPTAGCVEQCFYHDLPAGRDGLAHMRLVNAALGVSLEVAFRRRELPFFTQWKMMGRGEYVLGLEPANCRPDGQQKERENGTLAVLRPGKSTESLVAIGLAYTGRSSDTKLATRSAISPPRRKGVK